jgi:hypothetical protein
MSGAELKKLEGEIFELRAKIAGKEKEVRSQEVKHDTLIL